MKKVLFFASIIFFMSCSRSPTLNLRPRTFGSVPRHVVWLQVPGLELEHIAMLRFARTDSRRLSVLEEVDCVGAAWSYSYYDIRTNARESSLVQLTGSADVKNNCATDERFPAWQYYRALGFNPLALEMGTGSENSLEQHASCNGEKFLDGLTWVTMRAAPNKKEDKHLFHYQSKRELQNGQMHWDQTCQAKDGKCYASLSNNVKTMWENRTTNSTLGTFFLIRDFSYLKNLKNKDVKAARESLSEVEKVVSYFREQSDANQILILVTAGESQSLRFPKRGDEWEQFEKAGKNVLFERSKLMSPVLARGPSAENFCGVYEESRILYRHFWRQVEGGEFSLEKIIGAGTP